MEWPNTNWCPTCGEPMEINEKEEFDCKKCNITYTGKEQEPKPTDSAGFNLKTLYK